MKSLHCLPIHATSMDVLGTRLRAEAKEADVVEIWLDSVKDLRLAEIFFEKADIKKPFLFVNKAPFEGGDFMGTPEERVGILVDMFERGAPYVDLALQTDKVLIDKLVKERGEGSQLILSYHDFKTTPSLAKLKDLVRQAVKAGADIVKLATFIHERKENVILFEITRWAVEEGIKVIVVGMGEEGKISRIICPVLGSEMYYAPLNRGDETAEGQLTKDELQQIWGTIDV